MKKIFALLLCFVLVFSVVSMTSCTEEELNAAKETLETLNGKTPEDLYEESRNALALAGSYEVISQSDIVIKMEYLGQNMDMVMKQNTVSRVNGDDNYSKSTATTEMLSGEEFDSDEGSAETEVMEVWYVDGICYGDIFGQKVKVALDKEEFLEKYMGKDPKETTLMDIPESWFKDIGFKKETNGYSLNLTVSGEEYTKYFATAFEDFPMEVNIEGDVEYKLFFNSDGELTKATADFSFGCEIMGVTATATCTSVNTVSVKDIAVTAPENADEFVETELN